MQNYDFTPRVIFFWKAWCSVSVYVCHDILFLLHGTWVYIDGGSVLAASLQSGGLATYICSGDFVTISGSLAAISVVCSGWVGRVVSPHGVRLVRGCYGWLWVGISAFMIYLFCICYGAMGFILISVLGQGPDKSDSEVWSVLGYGWVMLHTEFTELTLYFHLCRKSPTIVGLELWGIRSGHIICKVGFSKLVYFYYFIFWFNFGF